MKGIPIEIIEQIFLYLDIEQICENTYLLSEYFIKQQIDKNKDKGIPQTLNHMLTYRKYIQYTFDDNQFINEKIIDKQSLEYMENVDFDNYINIYDNLLEVEKKDKMYFNLTYTCKEDKFKSLEYFIDKLDDLEILGLPCLTNKDKLDIIQDKIQKGWKFFDEYYNIDFIKEKGRPTKEYILKQKSKKNIYIEELYEKINKFQKSIENIFIYDKELEGSIDTRYIKFIRKSCNLSNISGIRNGGLI